MCLQGNRPLHPPPLPPQQQSQTRPVPQSVLNIVQNDLNVRDKINLYPSFKNHEIQILYQKQRNHPPPQLPSTHPNPVNHYAHHVPPSQPLLAPTGHSDGIVLSEQSSSIILRPHQKL